AIRVGHGVLATELRADEVHVAVGLSRRHAGLQPPLDEHPAIAAPLERRLAWTGYGVDVAGRLDLAHMGGRQPEFRRDERNHARERRRRDADDGVGLAA